MKFLKEISVLVIALCLTIANSQHCCTKDKLVRELIEDLQDNGKLDCLRSSANVDSGEETEEQRRRRIAANWDGDCSFEAESDSGEEDWRKLFVKNYGVKFVDVAGTPNEPEYQDFDDQADMCEIVRAFVAAGKFSFGVNMNNINLELVDKVDCNGSETQSQLCACTTGSFAEKSKWVIFLEAKSIQINGIPKYTIEPEN